jgi:glycosyltransferase involved in cell wall biosynthesis
MQPILSIITVTRNCRSTLGDTLSSIKLIKNSNIEYIVIDGASTDGTVGLIKKSGLLVDKYVSEIDTGIYNAMNKGINLASGKYSLFINGDDQVLAEEFGIVLALLEKGKSDIYCAKTLALGIRQYKEVLIAKRWQLPFFNSVPHPSAFVRTDLLKKFRFREDLKIAADYDLFLRLFMNGKSFKRINVVSAIHHRGGASGNSIQSSAEINQIRKEILGPFFYITESALKVYRFLKKIKMVLLDG